MSENHRSDENSEIAMKPILHIALFGSLISFGAAHAGQDRSPNETRVHTQASELIIRTGETSYRPSGPAPDFAALDTNHDGNIGESEASGYALLANDFKMADRNRDGRISKSEYQRWAAKP